MLFTTSVRPILRASHLAAAGLVLAVAASGAPHAAAQATEHHVYVSVLDQQGNPVTEVTPADLKVTEDGVTREVLRVGPATTPMEVVLLVDNSAATSADTMFFRDALEAFVAGLDDRHAIALVTLGDRPTLELGATTNTEAIRKAIGRLFPRPGSGTYLLDAVRDTTKGFTKRKPARPVIVAVLREDVEFSTGDHVSILTDLHETFAAFHAVVLNTPADPSIGTNEWRERAQLIDRGTIETGGRRVNLISNLGLKDAMVALATELNAQVEAVFARPASLVPPRRTTVSSAREGWTARGTLARPLSGQVQ
ncbi:MAG: VWFA-related Acidobacterial domain protein [Acidobacteria bacterium]|nr:VWFA-related Acidobacterial domain protein [Acidobacteriota bacterium]